MGTVRLFRHSTRLFRYHIPTEFVLLAVIEFLVLMLSLYLALEIRFFGDSWKSSFGAFLPKAFLYATVMQLSLVAFGVYQRQTGRFFEALALRIASGLMLGLIPLGISFYFAPTLFLGRGVLAVTVLFSFIFISLVRLYFRRIVKERNMWSRILVLGSGNSANLVRKAEKDGSLRGLNIVAYVSLTGNKEIDLEDEGISLDKSLSQYVEERDIDEIVLAMDDRRGSDIPDRDLLDCKMSGIDVLDLPTFSKEELEEFVLI